MDLHTTCVRASENMLSSPPPPPPPPPRASPSHLHQPSARAGSACNQHKQADCNKGHQGKQAV